MKTAEIKTFESIAELHRYIIRHVGWTLKTPTIRFSGKIPDDFGAEKRKEGLYSPKYGMFVVE